MPCGSTCICIYIKSVYSIYTSGCEGHGAREGAGAVPSPPGQAEGEPGGGEEDRVAAGAALREPEAPSGGPGAGEGGAGRGEPHRAGGRSAAGRPELSGARQRAALERPGAGAHWEGQLQRAALPEGLRRGLLGDPGELPGLRGLDLGRGRRLGGALFVRRDRGGRASRGLFRSGFHRRPCFGTWTWTRART